jgi:hypothetical protein
MARKTRFYVRNPATVLVGAGPQTIAVAPGGRAALLTTIAGDALSALVRTALEPVPAAALRRHADARTLALLVEHQVLIEGDSAEALRARAPTAPAERIGKKPCKHLVLGVTGAINAIYACALASHLSSYFCERLDVVLTRAARRIVRPQAFRYLGIPTWTDAFATRGDVNVPHMHLAAADLVLILPASAATLHKLATGACNDLLSLVCTATRAPIVVAPSMNGAMWDDAAVADNVQRLRARGVYMIEPTMGTEVSDKQAATWELGPCPVDPRQVTPALAAVLAASATRTTR